MINALILTLSLLLTNNDACLSGIVTDSRGKPLDNVHVYAEDNSAETFSDVNGTYSITRPENNDSTILCFSAIGYEQTEQTTNTGRVEKIILYDKAVNIDEVVINSNRHGKISDYASQKVEINPFEVYTSPTAFGDILGVLKTIPGAQSPGNDGRLYVRGGSSDESKVFVDGLMVYNPYTLSQKNVSVRSRFSPNMFQGVSLQSGGYGCEYGQALSGLISLNTKDKLDQKIDVNLTTTGVDGAIVSSTKKSQIYLGMAYTNMKPYGQIFKDEYNWKKYYEDLSGNFLGIFTFSKRLEVKMQFSFSQSSVDFAHLDVDSVLFKNKLSETYVWGQSTWNYVINKNSRLYFGSNLIINKFRGTDVNMKGDSVQTCVLFNHNKFAFEHKRNQFIYSMGAEAFYSKFDQDYCLIKTYHSDIKNLLLSGFYKLTYIPTDLTCISFGLRAEYSSVMSKYNLAPRLYASHKFKDYHILSFSAGTYFQDPGYDYLKLNKNLDCSKSDNITWTYAYAKNKSKFQVDTYYKKYTHLVTYKEGELFHTNISNKGDGYAYGMDFFLKGYKKMLEYWVSYSYIDSRRLHQSYIGKRMPDLISGHLLKLDLKYWISPIRSLIGAGYHIESGSYGDVMINGRSILMKTPFRNSLTLNLSYLPFSNTILHFACHNVLGSNNIYGYAGSSYQDRYRAETTPSKHFYYLGIFLTFNASKINNQLNSL